jgi:PAS domain S-box-containing protein
MESERLLDILPEPALVLLLTSGILLAINARFEQSFGFLRTNCTGKSLAELGACGIAEHSSFLRELVNAGPGGPFELKLWSADGTGHDVTVAAQLLDDQKALLLIRDVTAERRASRELNHKAEMHQLVFDSSLDAISISRLRDGRYVDVNEGFLRSGYARDDVIGKTDRDLGVWADPSEFWRFTVSLLKDKHVYNMETNFRLPSGTVAPALLSARIVTLQGEPYVVAFTRGIARLKETQRQLEQAREVASAASRAKSEFLATVSHEIRTPMNVILGLTEMLQEAEMPVELRGYLDGITNNGHALLDLINNLLDLAKIESGKLGLEVVDFDLAELIERTADALKMRAAEKGIALKVRLGAEAPRIVKGDPLRLRLVLTNLIGNAIKFTERGEVSLTVDSQRGAGEDDVLDFSVSDTGIGIAPDNLRNIFAPFEQADSSFTRGYGGSGLGLAIVERIVGLMNGRVWVESELGKGSNFHFRVSLPAADPATLQEAHKGTQSLGSGAADDGAVLPQGVGERSDLTAKGTIPLRILLADDSTDNRLLLRAYLRRMPYELDEAPDGEVALEKFRAAAYDLVIMDIQMPKLDGYSAVRRMREWEVANRRRRTPVIALTAHALEDAVDETRRAGCDLYLSKPLSKMTLLRAIAQALDID